MNIKTDTNGYAIMTNGSFEIVRDRDCIAQDIRAGLKTLLGEWYLDESIGVDYLEGTRKGNDDDLAYMIKKCVLGRVGVQEIKKFTLTVDSTRHATVDMEIQTIDGVIKYSEVLV